MPSRADIWNSGPTDAQGARLQEQAAYDAQYVWSETGFSAVAAHVH
jgi:hypothetical protein